MKLSLPQFKSLLLRDFSSNAQNVNSILFYGEEDLFTTEKVHVFVTKALKEKLSNLMVIESEKILSKEVFLGEILMERTLFEAEKKAIWVRGAPEKILPFLQEYIEGRPAEKNAPLLIVTADRYLKPSSKMRQYYEDGSRTFSMGCFAPTMDEIQKKIEDILEQFNKKIPPLVLKELSARFLGNPSVLVTEMQKLISYMGDRTSVDPSDLLECIKVDDLGAYGDFLGAFFKKDLNKSMRYLKRDLDRGGTSIGFLRMMLAEAQRLYSIHCSRQEGCSLEQAFMKVIPPVFPGQREAVSSCLNKWSAQELENLFAILKDAEIQTKNTSDLAVLTVEKVILISLSSTTA